MSGKPSKVGILGGLVGKMQLDAEPNKHFEDLSMGKTEIGSNLNELEDSIEVFAKSIEQRSNEMQEEKAKAGQKPEAPAAGAAAVDASGTKPRTSSAGLRLILSQISLMM